MNKNPLNKDEKDRQEKEPARIEPDIETDKFSVTEQKKIVEMVLNDVEIGIQAMSDWKVQKEIDLMHINSEKPSVIEGLHKKGWQSDRNLGLAAGILDIYQAVLLATCYNPDSIHFRDEQENDVDNKDNLEKFTKWGLSQSEANFYPEAEDYISNKVGLGTSFFKIYWEVKYEWIDKRIPKVSKASNAKRIIGYDIETEKRRFERGVIKNIDHLDDILLPEFGKNLQELPFIIERLHLKVSDLVEFSNRGITIDISEDMKKKFMSSSQVNQRADRLKDKDAAYLGVGTNLTALTTEQEMRIGEIEVYEWYGWYEKGGKYERFRFWVEPNTRTFLSGKPLRKINRSGKYPYVGGPLRRRPGFIRGGSMTSLIAPLINALNNNYNQTADFQYFENCPFGFFDKNQEGLDKSIYEIEPMKLFGVDGDPSKAVYLPNLSRSLAWSDQDKRFLLEMIERLTGAASYFLTSKSPGTTATRDQIVDQKSDTKFSLWVKSIQYEFAEAINMWIQLYQDWAPPKLGQRVLGENGKQIIRNLSIDSLRGYYSGYMTPDITSGSKSYDKQVKLWAFAQFKMGSVWMDPRMNPRGNWLLDKEAMKAQGIANPEHFLPPQPKEKTGTSQEVKSEWQRFMNGDIIDPNDVEGMTPAVVEHYVGHMKQYEESYQDLDEEYRANFDNHLFKTSVNYGKFMAKLQEEMVANAIAQRAAVNLERNGMMNQQPPMGQQPLESVQAPPQPMNMNNLSPEGQTSVGL